MSRDRFRYLLEKHIADSISDTEADELLILMQQLDANLQEEVLEDILGGQQLEYRMEESRKQLVYAKVRRSVAQQPQKRALLLKLRRSTYKKYFPIAAVLIIGLFVLLWTLDRNSGIIDANKEIHAVHPSETLVDDIYLDNDLIPTVRLPDGKIRTLDEGDADVLATLGVKVEKGEDGEILYQVQHPPGDLSSQAEDKIVFSTPKGITSRVVLLDGTQVWLNSGSSLEYPIVFSEKERKVKLSGEAYFDVARMENKPFYVETDHGPLVKVLGTEFNVSAYEDEGVTTTTLVKGAVQLLGKHHSVVLKPSEQSVAGMDDVRLRKRNVTTQDFISWKEGYFNFDGHSVEAILSKVQRWYNVEKVVYDYFPEDKFTGTFKRTKSLKSLLTKLEKISNVKFEIRERRIMVTK